MKNISNSVISVSRDGNRNCCDLLFFLNYYYFCLYPTPLGEIRSCKPYKATMYFNSISGFVQTLKESPISCLVWRRLERASNVLQENLLPIINNRKPGKQTFADTWNWNSNIYTETWKMKQPWLCRGRLSCGRCFQVQGKWSFTLHCKVIPDHLNTCSQNSHFSLG